MYFLFATATKKNNKNSNIMESVTLHANGPITGRVYIRGGGGFSYNRFKFRQVDGPTQERMAYNRGGFISGGIYNRDFTVF